MAIVKAHLPKFSGHSGKIKWAIKEGDHVGKGEKLLDLDFEYLLVPLPSPCSGLIKTIVVHEGHGANSGAVVATIEAAETETAIALSPLPIYASCGLIRIGGAPKCEHCGKDHAQTILSVPRSNAAKWVAIECKFQCRMCGFVVPLNHVEVDGAVICARCGLEQAFDVRGWDEGLAHAHGVVDGMDAEVGNKKIVSRYVVNSMNALEVSASPGFPLCETCHAPFQIEIDDGKSTAKCATCATTDYYVVPGKTRELTKGALVAVVSVEHRTDRDAVKVEDASGAMAIKCPSCSAPLEPVEGSKFVTCKFCKTAARIPDGILFKISGVAPVPELIWLAFHGPSREKKVREEQALEHESDSLEKKLRDAQGRWKAERSRQEEIAHAQEKARLENQEKQAEIANKATAEKAANRFVLILVLAIVVVSFGGVGIWAIFFQNAP